MGEAVTAGADAGATRSGIVASPLKSRILVVGDDARTLQAFERILGSLGLDFVTEATARAALQRVRETDYAVIFLTGTNGDAASGLAREIIERKAVEKELRNSEQKLRALAAHIQSVREVERTRIAREVHDELGQALTGLKMDLSWLEKRLPGNLTAPAGKIRSMFRLIDDTIQSVRRIAADLRPQVLDEVGLPGALKWQAKEFQARTGIRCRIELPEREFDMAQDRSTAVFRIFQEAMTNVARHAKATRVDIKLRLDADRLILSVLDNGLGIARADSRSSKSLGLLGVRERALLLGGEVEIEGNPDGGTCVTLSVPLQLQGER